jgi:hypothetical protein
MPWTRHDKDDTTLQNVGSHFRDAAVPNPTKLVSWMWKVVFLVNLMCYFFTR